MKPDIRNPEAGMSLLEIMFAAGVVGTALAMMFGSLMTIGQVSEVAEDYMTAANQVDKIFEEIRETPVEDLLRYQPPTLEYGPGEVNVAVALAYDSDGSGHWLPATTTSETGETTTASLNLPNPAEIRVLVVWIDGSGRVQSLDASTHIGF